MKGGEGLKNKKNKKLARYFLGDGCQGEIVEMVRQLLMGARGGGGGGGLAVPLLSSLILFLKKRESNKKGFKRKGVNKVKSVSNDRFFCSSKKKK